MSGFEQIAVERGPRSGARLAIAVHSTRLGPALGGARMWHYGDTDAAIADAMRLAESMTLKAAAAGLDLGGGKGVIATPEPVPPTGELRRVMLEDFGDLVESLEGRYVTAEDVGTGLADMEVIAGRTRHVVGRDQGAGGSGDPSPVTALGVRAAMRACAAHRFGPAARGLQGLTVVVVGLGHVGANLAELLARDGARLLATDIDPTRRTLVERLGGEWVPPAEALASRCDVLAPCALGGALTPASAAELGAAIVCGAANNVLSDPGVAELLERREILYAPDFIANAGGLISVYGELHSLPHGRATELAAGIEATVAELLRLAERERITTLAAARRLAERRLAGAGQPGSAAALAAEVAALQDS